ncbi:MAG: LptA/OstA family protein [Geminicoccaceae bacterium]
MSARQFVRRRQAMKRCQIGALCVWSMFLISPAQVLAQEGGLGDHDTRAPIEITADELEVRQAESLARFSGNVDAIQGEVTLHADTLDVFYGDGNDSAGSEGLTGDIRRIVAIGNVVMSSPRETATGRRGVYDVATSLVTMEGDVVLTRDENVIRGDRAEINLATGVSQMKSAADGSGGRVRALIVPNGGDRDDNGG